MSNSAQLLVHNIRAMQSLSIQAKRDGQRQDFKGEQRGVPQTHTHMHTCTHSMQQLQSKHNNPALPRSTGGCQGVQWRATVSTWELVKQQNPNKTKKKGGNCWAGRGYPFRHSHPILDPGQCTQISGAVQSQACCGDPQVPSWPCFCSHTTKKWRFRLLPLR